MRYQVNGIRTEPFLRYLFPKWSLSWESMQSSCATPWTRHEPDCDEALTHACSCSHSLNPALCVPSPQYFHWFVVFFIRRNTQANQHFLHPRGAVGQAEVWDGCSHQPSHWSLLPASHECIGAQNPAKDGKTKLQLQEYWTGWLMVWSSTLSFSTINIMVKNIFSFPVAFSTNIRYVGLDLLQGLVFTGPLLTK